MLNELALFAGAGGGILGGKLLGWQTVCAVENDAFCRGVLLARQNDQLLEAFPIWDDVRTFDGLPWRGLIDVVSGGFPCQDISPAGKGLGITGPKSGLWKHFARIIGQVAPPYVLIENSAMLVTRGLREVLEDLDELGYDAKWGDIRAEDAIWAQGNPCLDHERKRLWIRCHKRPTTGDGDGSQAGRLSGGCQPQIPVLGEPNSSPSDEQSERCSETRSVRREQSEKRPSCGDKETADSVGIGRREAGTWEPPASDQTDQDTTSLGRNDARRGEQPNPPPSSNSTDADASSNGCGQLEQNDDRRKTREESASPTPERVGGWWQTEPDVDRVVYGISHRVDRLRAIGNAQVPAVVKLAWETLKP